MDTGRGELRDTGPRKKERELQEVEKQREVGGTVGQEGARSQERRIQGTQSLLEAKK